MRYKNWQRWLQLLFFAICAAAATIVGGQGLTIDPTPNYTLALGYALPLAFAGFLHTANPHRFCCVGDNIAASTHWRRDFYGQVGCFLITAASMGTLGYLQFNGWGLLLLFPSSFSTVGFITLTFKDRYGPQHRVPEIRITFHPSPAALEAPLLLSTTPSSPHHLTVPPNTMRGLLPNPAITPKK